MTDMYVISAKRITDSKGLPLPEREKHWEYLIFDGSTKESPITHSFTNVNSVFKLNRILKFDSVDEAKEYYEEIVHPNIDLGLDYDISSLCIKRLTLSECSSTPLNIDN